MKRWLTPVFAAVLVVGFMSAGSAFASDPSTFDFHAGDSFGGDLASPDVTAAANGDTVTIVASGSFDKRARTATGSGTFEHRAGDGTLLANGTFTVTKFIGFGFFGCGFAGGEPIPPDLCGGVGAFQIHATAHPGGDPSQTVELDATLQVSCLLGRAPAGGVEGIRLRIPGLITFDTPVSGETVFVST